MKKSKMYLYYSKGRTTALNCAESYVYDINVYELS